MIQNDRVIGLPLTDAERHEFIRRARSCVGVRFRHQGRDPKTGLDCAGLTAYAMKGIRIFQDVRGYGRHSQNRHLAQALRLNLGAPLSRDDAASGDVALMKFSTRHSTENHIGILADYVYGGLSLIHSYAVNKRVIEHRLDDEWRSRITEVYRP